MDRLSITSDETEPQPNTLRRPALKDIMRLTGFSRATIDRALNTRDGVRPSTLAAVQAAVKTLMEGGEKRGVNHGDRRLKSSEAGDLTHFTLLLQADEEFAHSVIAKAEELAPAFANERCRLKIIQCTGFSTEQMEKAILDQADGDGVAILGENSFPVIRAASELRNKGLAVVTTNTELDPTVRHAFVGIDNRAAGLAAGFMMGRHLCRLPTANVAVVVETIPFRCHEEREMGFRSILRQRFPSINVINVVRWNGSRDSTYTAARDLLKQWPTIDGIYNTSGGNHGLAQALEEEGRLGEVLFIAHEVNAVTEPLIRRDAIDYLITQSLDALVSGTVETLLAVTRGERPNPVTMIPPEILCKYSMPGR